MVNSFEPALTTSFIDQTLVIHKMKPPFLKRDKNGIPISSGYICFSVDMGNNSFEEHYVACTSKILQDVIKKKLFNLDNLKITLTFDKKGVVIDMDIETDFKKEGYYGFEMHPDDARKLESEIYDIGTKFRDDSDAIKDCIFHILDKPNKDGVYAELTFVPKHADKNAVAKILQIVSDKAEAKQKISARDIIDGKYLVSSVNNDGEYVYISPNPINI